MKFPFTAEQFLEQFKNYNLAFFPLQVLFYVLAVIMLLSAAGKLKVNNRLCSIILGSLWLWMGIAYHLIYFTRINPAAYVFGLVFIIQGLAFFYFGIIKNRLSFLFKKDIAGIAGAVFIGYALLFYPLLSYLNGHFYPAAPGFGLPCPTAIFTFGILLWTDKKLPLGILLIPVGWAGVSLSAAVSLGMTEDYGLIIAAVISFVLILFQNRKFYNPPMYSLRG